MQNSVKVSVIMGLYNCASTLREALSSIESQSFTNWEVVMCDDGSSDDTYELALSYVDKNPTQFVLIRNEHNLGLNETLNRCLSIANGSYIARMDADDLSHPDRFKLEVEFLDANPEYAFVSSPMILFDERGDWGIDKGPEKPTARDLMVTNPFCHAACMIRREALLNVEGYSTSTNLLRVEDLHLWLKLYEYGYKGYNIQNPLYKMRDDRAAYSRRLFKYRINEAYVKYLTVKKLRLNPLLYFYVLRPIIVGLLPAFLYDFLHKISLKG